MSSENNRRQKNPAAALFLALALWSSAIAVVVYGFREWFPPLASQHGAGIDLMLNYLLLTVGALFLVGHLVLGYFVWRFSRNDRVTHRVPGVRAERIWSVIPAVVITLVAEGGVLVLGLPVWGKFYATEAPSDAVTVEVTGEQFAWNVRYPGKDGLFGGSDPQLMSLSNPLGLDPNDPAAADDIALLGEMYLPVNRPARIRLRSKDTLHSFFLPNLRVKQDAVPGMTIDFWFVPTRAGEYEIACAELCGFGHFQMRGLLHVVSENEFEQRLEERPPYSTVF